MTDIDSSDEGIGAPPTSEEDDDGVVVTLSFFAKRAVNSSDRLRRLLEEELPATDIDFSGAAFNPGGGGGGGGVGMVADVPSGSFDFFVGVSSEGELSMTDIDSPDEGIGATTPFAGEGAGGFAGLPAATTAGGFAGGKNCKKYVRTFVCFPP